MSAYLSCPSCWSSGEFHLLEDGWLICADSDCGARLCLVSAGSLTEIKIRLREGSAS